jgi:hypothetical protein
MKRRLMPIIVVALVLGGSLCAKRVYNEALVYWQLCGQHPIARELWHGQIRPGDDVERLVSRLRPHFVSRRGRFVSLRYCPRPGPARNDVIYLAATEILAKDGKVRAATSYSCTFQRVHFDETEKGDDERFALLLHESPGYRPDLGDLHWVN